jgi:hypothetical protein
MTSRVTGELHCSCVDGMCCSIFKYFTARHYSISTYGPILVQLEDALHPRVPQIRALVQWLCQIKTDSERTAKSELKHSHVQ